ncbi:MAG: hypothetical protein COT85_07175 [Chlamydiae bacterium CG10_big_fil_rev_8_21_14_0_10_42_34]|nr:MAG: hypothetical protein COT85_07175 [Chlamydiae bacterium CG10_big_fil_rev_8_21_14_0_10_42_34]
MYILFAIAIFAAFDSTMSPQEIKKTGTHKLSAKEKRALGEWIDKNYSKNEIAARKKQPPILQENLKNGHYIRLSDNSLWEINPEDTPITQGWITAVEIKASPSNDPDYPYILTNTLTESTVRARKADTARP